MLEPQLSEGEVIYERSKVVLTNEDGTVLELGIETQNGKVLFSKEKQIYEAVVERLKNNDKNVYYLDDGNKVMLSYNGKLLISYANGSRTYQNIVNLYATLGATSISFVKK